RWRRCCRRRRRPRRRRPIRSPRCASAWRGTRSMARGGCWWDGATCSWRERRTVGLTARRRTAPGRAPRSTRRRRRWCARWRWRDRAARDAPRSRPRARLARDLKLARRTPDDGWLGELAKRRAVCVSMAFERPPDVRPRVGWAPRSLVWVAGPQGKVPAVPARDFVFAALRVGLDAHDLWADPALGAYTRAARLTRALCEPLATFKVSAEVASCRR